MNQAQQAELQRYKWSFELNRVNTDFEYLCQTYFRIKGKHVIGMPTLLLNPVQQFLVQKMREQQKRIGKIRQIWGKARQVGSCVHPQTKILKSDLTWVPIDEIVVGDSLVSTDEQAPGGKGKGRKMRAAVVLAKNDVYEPAYQLTFDNGRTLIATPDHRFLCVVLSSRKNPDHKKNKYGIHATGTTWKHVKHMKIGDSIRFLVHPWESGGYEDGWFGGILDGEGSLRKKEKAGSEVTVTQVAGDVLDRAIHYLDANQYAYRFSIDTREAGISSKLGSKPVCRLTLGRMNDIFRLVGQTRPSRFLSKDWWENKDIPGRGWGIKTAWPKITEIKYLGMQRMLDLQTSTKTYIAEGFVSHNSTLCRAIICKAVFFNKAINALSVAHDDDVIKELFDTDKTFWDLLPEQLRPSKKYDSTTKMEFNHLRSKTLINHARNPNVGAATMNHILHLTEAARYTDADRVYPSLEPSMSEATGDIFGNCSIRIIESTSVYGGWWFKDFAESAMKGEMGDYEFYFVPWFVHHDYRRTPPEGFEPSYEERQWLQKYPQITYENLAWFRTKRAEYRANPMKIYQEYPKNWQESWVLPEGTNRVFPYEVTKALSQKDIKPGKRMNCTRQGFEKAIDGPLEVWELPKEGVFYHFGLDPSGGMDGNADPSGMVVMREDTMEVVAISNKRWNAASREYLDFVYSLGMHYNFAQIVPDVTGGWGQAVITELRYRNYPNVWQHRRRDDAKGRVSMRMGFAYSKREKSNLVNRALVLVEKHLPAVRSRALLDQMEGFLSIGDDEWGASAGEHDDLINAYMLAIMSAADESILLDDEPEPPKTEPRDPILQQNIDEILQESELSEYGDLISPFTT